MIKEEIYRISFISHKNIYEIYAKTVANSSLYGFIEVGGLLFSPNNHLVVDPTEEKLKTEFNEVSKFYIPLHTILRIDVVKKIGGSKIRVYSGDKNENITAFPHTTPSNFPHNKT